MSFIDDIKTISISSRLVTQIICASITLCLYVYPGLRLFNTAIPHVLEIAIVLIFYVAFINVYNFMDGIDGLTAAESIHLSSTIILLCLFQLHVFQGEVIPYYYFVILTAIIILAFSVSFIFFNWYPARIFIGDVGTIGIGFLFGLCFILISSCNFKLFLASIISCLYYVADGGITIIRRLSNGEEIWKPHLRHFFQQAVKGGMKHSAVVTKIVICNLFLMLLAISSLYYQITSILLALLTVTVTLVRFVK